MSSGTEPAYVAPPKRPIRNRWQSLLEAIREADQVSTAETPVVDRTPAEVHVAARAGSGTAMAKPVAPGGFENGGTGRHLRKGR